MVSAADSRRQKPNRNQDNSKSGWGIPSGGRYRPLKGPVIDITCPLQTESPRAPAASLQCENGSTSGSRVHTGPANTPVPGISASRIQRDPGYTRFPTTTTSCEWSHGTEVHKNMCPPNAARRPAKTRASCDTGAQAGQPDGNPLHAAGARCHRGGWAMPRPGSGCRGSCGPVSGPGLWGGPGVS